MIHFIFWPANKIYFCHAYQYLITKYERYLIIFKSYQNTGGGHPKSANIRDFLVELSV